MTETASISFDLLGREHFDLMLHWFNKPHVQSYYSLRDWTSEDVETKFSHRAEGAGDLKGYIVSIEKCPVGFIQCYPVKNHPWENQNLTEKIVQYSAGIDLLIGEEDWTGKGLGSEIVEVFLEKYVWPDYLYCLADPNEKNEASIGLFNRLGFKKHRVVNTKDALGRPCSLVLFIKSRPEKPFTESYP